MMFEKIIRNKRQVISSCREMFRISFLLTRTRIRNVKVGDMPILNHQPKCTSGLKSFKLTQSFNCQNIWRIKLLLFSIQRLISFREIFFICNRITTAIRKIKKSERSTVTSSLIAQYFTRHDSPPSFVRLNLQNISNQSLMASDLQSKLQR
ncbi:hypothetical protein WK01_05235 [Burkholderia cepacia]|nr:hypothetical protein WK01_05235 [Burkholderia cepacia]